MEMHSFVDNARDKTQASAVTLPPSHALETPYYIGPRDLLTYLSRYGLVPVPPQLRGIYSSFVRMAEDEQDI